MRYGYCRVGTSDQSCDPQFHELVGEGVPPENIRCEIVAGAFPAEKRPQFMELRGIMKAGDSLTVTKLDRIGRNASDVLRLLSSLKALGISVRILQLGADTDGSAGTLILGILASVAEWEREIISERTKAGLKAAVARGEQLGRRPVLNKMQRVDVLGRLVRGESVTNIARFYGISTQAVYRIKWASDQQDHREKMQDTEVMDTLERDTLEGFETSD